MVKVNVYVIFICFMSKIYSWDSNQNTTLRKLALIVLNLLKCLQGRAEKGKSCV